jgi:ferredoxin-NADP reductase
VLQIEVEKPSGFSFIPGQATEISINRKGWKARKNPFTFTSLPHENHLQFVIKTYPSHQGVTNQLLQARKGDELILHDVFGAIAYKTEGVFIAGGAGITPFIAIFRDLQSKNKINANRLIFANKTKGDIILEDEFTQLLGKNFINILADEDVEGYAHGLITKDFLKAHIPDTHTQIYLCGPEAMMAVTEGFLADLHIDKGLIVKEAI